MLAAALSALGFGLPIACTIWSPPSALSEVRVLPPDLPRRPPDLPLQTESVDA